MPMWHAFTCLVAWLYINAERFFSLKSPIITSQYQIIIHTSRLLWCWGYPPYCFFLLLLKLYSDHHQTFWLWVMIFSILTLYKGVTIISKSWILIPPTYQQTRMAYWNTFNFVGTPLFFTRKNSLPAKMSFNIFLTRWN